MRQSGGPEAVPIKEMKSSNTRLNWIATIQSPTTVTQRRRSEMHVGDRGWSCIRSGSAGLGLGVAEAGLWELVHGERGM